MGLGVARAHRRRYPDARRIPDKTVLENIGAKASAAFTEAVRGNFTFFSGNKQKDGRGAGPDNPPETTWIQNGPSKMYKAEVSYVASNRCS